MGGVFTCIDEIPDVQRYDYDLTAIKSNPVPIVWFVGPPGSGRKTLTRALAENLGYQNIQIAELLRTESEKDNERAKIIQDAFKNPPKKVPDTLVIDLIKEAMLEKFSETKGFILNGFPRTYKQASLFVKEIGDVDVVLYLYSDTQVLISRSLNEQQEKDLETLKRDIQSYIKEVKESLIKFGPKVEKIHADAPLGDVYGRVETAINVRLNMKSSIMTSEEYPFLPEV